MSTVEQHITTVEAHVDAVEERLAGVEKRLADLESSLHTVKNDTRLIPITFDLVRIDGAEVGELKVRVKKLEDGS